MEKKSLIRTTAKPNNTEYYTQHTLFSEEGADVEEGFKFEWAIGIISNNILAGF